MGHHSKRNKKNYLINHFHFLHSVITYNRGQDNEFKLSSTVILDRSKFSKTSAPPNETQLHELKNIICKDFKEIISQDKAKIDQNLLWNLNNLDGGKTKLLYRICVEHRFGNSPSKLLKNHQKDGCFTSIQKLGQALYQIPNLPSSPKCRNINYFYIV